MAYSEAQAARVRGLLTDRPGLAEKEMFGGVAFLLRGNICVGVHGDDLIVRVEPGETDALLREPGAKPFSLSGRAGMAGWLLVAPSGCKSERALRAWVDWGVAYASSLPPKKAKKT